MCEQDDLDEFARRSGEVTRRQFGAMALGAGLVAALPKLAIAVATSEADVEIKTPDGVADAYFVHPAKGKFPGVLIWPDIFGLRPTFKEMATRLAESGYSVLVINPFYRTKKAPTAPDHPDFNDPATRQALMTLAGTLTPVTAVTDAKAFVAFLDNQPSVDKRRKMGTTGYCMGGPFTMRTAAAFPDRVGAGATFHGGGLVTDKPEEVAFDDVPVLEFSLIDITEVKADEAAIADMISRAWTKCRLKTEGWFVLRLRQDGKHQIEFPV